MTRLRADRDYYKGEALAAAPAKPVYCAVCLRTPGATSGGWLTVQRGTYAVTFCPTHKEERA